MTRKTDSHLISPVSDLEPGLDVPSRIDEPCRDVVMHRASGIDVLVVVKVGQQAEVGAVGEGGAVLGAR